MTRQELIAAVGGGALVPVSPAAHDDGVPCRSMLAWRYVVPLGDFRVGILAAESVAVIEQQGKAPVRINLPRASPGSARWTPSSEPKTPYRNPEERISDVIRGGGPDEVSFAAPIGAAVILGVATPESMPMVDMPSFLIRITPSTRRLETYAMPESLKGTLRAAYRLPEERKIVVYSDAGRTIVIDE